MNNSSIYDELDQAIDQIAADPGAAGAVREPEISDLMDMVSDLRQIPSPDFKTRLKTELEWVAASRPLSPARQPQAVSESFLPSLFGNGYAGYPMRHANFAASLVLHAAAMVVVLGATFWLAKHPQTERRNVNVMPLTIDLGKVAEAITPHGGGGGGDASKVDAPKGDLPRPDTKQITPPVVVQLNMKPHFPVEPTIIAPNLHVPQSEHMGDPLAKLMIPSNGPGVSAGIGSGSEGGVGAGIGAGTGSGNGGGFGTGVFSVGNGVSAPRVIYDPEPEYSAEARAAKHQGVVKIWAIIDRVGHVREARVKQPLGMGLDEKALEAVRTWRFLPAMKDGHAVPVGIEVEVGFHLY